VSSTVSVEQDEKPAAPFTTAAKAQSLLVRHHTHT
jgi:hypothetical protein